MELIALAIAPGLAICLFIFHRDAYNREPKLNLIVSFILGAATVITAFFIEQFLKNVGDNSIQGTAIKAFLVVGLTEELGKFVILRYYAYRKKSFDEPLDGIIYGVMISMGFATFENILYVVQSGETGMGYQVAFLRMFTAVPAHATFGVLMGYHAGKAKFDPPHEKKLLLTGLLWAVFFHGAYDFCLMLQGSPSVKPYVSDLLLFMGAIFSFSIAIRLSFKHIRLHRRLSQQTYRPTESMSIRKAFQHDIPLIRDLTDQIWPQTYSSILSSEQIAYMMNMMYSEKSLTEQMEQGHEFVIIYDGVQAIGFASIGMMEPSVYKLHKLYVLTSYQGKGTGRFAIQELVKAIKRKGGSSLLLNVNRQNDAKNFYEKIGFAVIREEDIDIGGGYFMNDYVMELKF
jgi:RsiW-degrading membrane proteinase PrsW (M82 family)/ribosomal protein S18 acetylase RimI-like enzyme